MTVQVNEFEDKSLDELLEFIETEEFTQLDELSKKTLGSYIKKASRSGASNSYQTRKSMEKDDHSGIMKNSDKVINRIKGIDRATDKLTKEDLEVVSGMIQDILTDNLVESKSTFSDLLASKLAVKLQEAKEAIAKSLFGEKKEPDEGPDVDYKNDADDDDDYRRTLHGKLKNAEDGDDAKHIPDDDLSGDKRSQRAAAEREAKGHKSEADAHRTIKLQSGEVKLKDGEAKHLNHFLGGLKPERRSQVLDHMHKSPEHFDSIHKVVKQFSSTK